MHRACLSFELWIEVLASVAEQIICVFNFDLVASISVELETPGGGEQGEVGRGDSDNCGELHGCRWLTMDSSFGMPTWRQRM
jgi:hypothetical protein